ncbi:MAG: chemotaxis protein CheX [Gammaproteobacteria bacterium]|jgi:chemotaxis protein CheX
MKAEFINPFLESIINVLDTMANVKASAGKPQRKEEDIARGDVTGVIGMASEQVNGSLAITFTSAAIFDIARRMLGEEVTEVDATVTDLVGEITNMVTGGAKRVLAEQGYDFDMAIPSVVAGKNHRISRKYKGTKIIIPFQIIAGKFFVEVCFD